MSLEEINLTCCLYSISLVFLITILLSYLVLFLDPHSLFEQRHSTNLFCFSIKLILLTYYPLFILKFQSVPLLLLFLLYFLLFYKFFNNFPIICLTCTVKITHLLQIKFSSVFLIYIIFFIF